MENLLKKFGDTFKYTLIYVYSSSVHKGCFKVGQTSIDPSLIDINIIKDNDPILVGAAKKRIDETTVTAGIDATLEYVTLAIKKDPITQERTLFEDTNVHQYLINQGIKRCNFNRAREWFECSLDDIINSIRSIKEGTNIPLSTYVDPKTNPIIFRDEQLDAINLTKKKFTSKGVITNSNDKFLWNAKMRFGKTLTCLELIKQLQFKKTLIITHRPVVKQQWSDDFKKIDFDNKYVFKSKADFNNFKKEVDKFENLIYFLSIQDLRGSSSVGGIYDKNFDELNYSWDFVVIDEAHEGTRTELGKEVLDRLVKATPKTKTLYLSGTPYNLLSSEDLNFSDDEVYTWDYISEQKAKYNFYKTHLGEHNPYESLPNLHIYTYDLNDITKGQLSNDIEDLSFNFKEFFRVNDESNCTEFSKFGKFKHEKFVKSFLRSLYEGENEAYPFVSRNSRNIFRHTFWLLPGVEECKALEKLLKEDIFFCQFDVINVAGDSAQSDPLKQVHDKIGDKPERTFTITLSCGRLNTGVTVKEWTAVFMLSGGKETSASSYLQTIFRAQSSCTIGDKIKTDCYVFDFAPDRTLKVISEAITSTRKELKSEQHSSRATIDEFLNFCPIIGVSGSSIKVYDTKEMLIQLKSATVDKVLRNGFDDSALFNINSLKLDNLDISNFEKLKKIIGSKKSSKLKDDHIIVNKSALGEEEHDITYEEQKEAVDKHLLSQEEKELTKKRNQAIKLLKSIAIRIPLLIYGADVEFERKIDVVDFVELVDDKSWIEFMPTGVTKEVFKDFIKYFDNEVFIEAGYKIRKKVKLADKLPLVERIEVLTNIFKTFKNPDKETVLTPWRVVNLHLLRTIGGYSFFDDDLIDEVRIEEHKDLKLIKNEYYTDDIYNADSKFLEINAKTGLYPLFCAFTLYKVLFNKGHNRNSQELYKNIIENNIFVICRTKMSKHIVNRTLRGYDSSIKVNTLVFEDMIPKLREKHGLQLVRYYLTNPKTWNKEGEEMKFKVVVGNPPYQQSENHNQLYPYFYLMARELGDYVSMIFPTGWQDPKNTNNLSKMNTDEIKKDRQIIFIDNRQNVFPGISGAEWINIILWKKGFDNNGGGSQTLYINGANPQPTLFGIDPTESPKPKELIELGDIVTSRKDFESMSKITSVRKPYGLSANLSADQQKYGLPQFEEKYKEGYLKLHCLENSKRVTKYISSKTKFPRTENNLFFYKVLVPKAWGNFSKTAGLGGAYADIIVAYPGEACSENFIEIGPFENVLLAYFASKFLLTKFARALLILNKQTHNFSKDKPKFIPLQSFTEPWWNESIEQINEHLFDKYNVPQEIRDFVNKNIQTKTEAGILNYKNEKK